MNRPAPEAKSQRRRGSLSACCNSCTHLISEAAEAYGDTWWINGRIDRQGLGVAVQKEEPLGEGRLQVGGSQGLSAQRAADTGRKVSRGWRARPSLTEAPPASDGAGGVLTTMLAGSFPTTSNRKRASARRVPKATNTSQTSRATHARRGADERNPK
jgi:hypothetical protein